MKNTAGDKVKQIINKEFDSRVAMAVVTYILDYGFEKLKKVKEEDILQMKGNALMTDEFVQALVRAAVRICKECNQIDDFLPYIVNHLYVPNAQMNDLYFDQDEMTKYRWETFICDLGIDYDESADEIEMVKLNATVLEVYRKGERMC